MDCPFCGGDPGESGCSECEDGKIRISGCPREFVTPDVWALLRYADLYDKGIPPVSGGALDQCRSFTDAASFAWNEKAHWEIEAMRRRR